MRELLSSLSYSVESVSTVYHSNIYKQSDGSKYKLFLTKILHEIWHFWHHWAGWNCLGGLEGLNPQFMSTDAHFCVKIGFKFQSLGKISYISTFDLPVLLFQFQHCPLAITIRFWVYLGLLHMQLMRIKDYQEQIRRFQTLCTPHLKPLNYVSGKCV